MPGCPGGGGGGGPEVLQPVRLTGHPIHPSPRGREAQGPGWWALGGAPASPPQPVPSGAPRGGSCSAGAFPPAGGALGLLGAWRGSREPLLLPLLPVPSEPWRLPGFPGPARGFKALGTGTAGILGAPPRNPNPRRELLPRWVSGPRVPATATLDPPGRLFSAPELGGHPEPRTEDTPGSRCLPDTRPPALAPRVRLGPLRRSCRPVLGSVTPLECGWTL